MKSRIIFILLVVILILIGFGMKLALSKKNNQQAQMEVITAKTAKSEIQAEGSVESEIQAKLTFQTSGKLVYLPFKEGDTVYKNQEIAGLDQYALQKDLAEALNNYRSTRDTFDQTQANNSTGVLQGSQQYTLETTNKVGLSGQGETNVINDMAKRILDENQANLDNSVIEVQLANYALQLSSLTSPINGVITHEDATTTGINITPSTTFTVQDPNHLIFKAQVLENDIDYVKLGQKAKIKMSSGRNILGTVKKIYPEKISLANGDKVYNVDIQSNQLAGKTKLGETGTVLIENNSGKNIVLIPTWTVLAKSYVWIYEKGKPVLKKVTTGKEHEGFTQIINGLKPGDKIIKNPKSIVINKYQML